MHAMISPFRHFIVTAHFEDSHVDEIHYVTEESVEAAQQRVKDHMRRTAMMVTPEVYCTAVVEIPGPPLAVHTEERIVDYPEALERDSELASIPTPEERAANHRAIMAMPRAARFKLMFGASPEDDSVSCMDCDSLAKYGYNDGPCDRHKTNDNENGNT